MSFRRVVVQSLLVVTAFAAGTAYAQTEAAAPGHAAPALGDAKAGEGKAAACGACHGMDGNPTDKQYPKLAGQNEAYIARQLELFKNGKRQNPIMMGFASTLSTQDMHDVGAYFATTASLPGTADDAVVRDPGGRYDGMKTYEIGQLLYRAGNAAAGVPACMACHGPDGRGMAGAGFPQLGGQWTDYVAAKLKEFKDGTLWGDDANAKVMPAIAQKLSDLEINALASYVEGLHTATGTSAAAK